MVAQYLKDYPQRERDLLTLLGVFLFGTFRGEQMPLNKPQVRKSPMADYIDSKCPCKYLQCAKVAFAGSQTPAVGKCLRHAS